MPTSTTNYGLIKPGTDDPILIEQLNDNADTIDAALKANADAIESKQDGLTTAQLAAVNSGIDSAKVAQIATNASDISDIQTALDDKVDKVSGKDLSTNDFTTAEKTKLDDLAEIKSIGTGLNLDDNGELTATGGGSGGTTNYNDLSNKPQINGNTLSGNKTSAQLGLASASDIPTVPITAIQKNGTDITPVSGTVNITVPTTAADVSALPDTTKYAAALSLTINSSTFVMTGQLKDQNGDNLGTAQTIDLPLESVVVNGSYNSQTKKVVLTLQNGSTIEFSVADLVAGLQAELSASNKLNPAYINYNSTHRAVSDAEKVAWNGKANTSDIPTPSTAEPLMDGTAAAGTSTDYARADHVHPSDTSKQDALTTAQLAAVNSGITAEKLQADETALADKVDKETGKGLSTNDYTTAEKTKLAGIAEGAEVNVQSNWAQTTTTADDYIKNKPTLGTAAAKNATDTYNATGTDVTTGKAVAAALATLPEPMVFKGSLGTGGTITTLPTASSSNKGYVYKVITAGTYASQSAKVGDTFISDGSAWVLVPSGDEPSGTVTNVAVANGGGLTVSGSPITSSGTITVGHSNSVTAKTSSSLKKFKYDAYGHVTGSSELSTTESNALASGINSTKVEQIETNKNNILTDEAALVGLVDGGAKNLIQVSATSSTTSGIVYTVSNGIITLESGTAANNPSLIGVASTITIPKGTYVLSGCPSGGGDSSYRLDMRIQGTSTVLVVDKGETDEVTLTSDTVCSFFIRLIGNYQVSTPLTFKPMLCTKAAWDISQIYQPYRPSYAELVEANRRKVYANTENNTSYTFSNLYGLNESRFKYALVCGGGTANNPALAMAWFVFIDDSGVVTARKIIGDSPRTLTGSVSGTTLTLTTDATMYGGLRLIWLS